jgi:hypothetical protein
MEKASLRTAADYRMGCDGRYVVSGFVQNWDNRLEMSRRMLGMDGLGIARAERICFCSWEKEDPVVR